MYTITHTPRLGTKAHAAAVCRRKLALAAALRAESDAATLEGAWRLAAVSERALRDLRTVQAGQPLVAPIPRTARNRARAGMEILGAVGAVIAAAMRRAAQLAAGRAVSAARRVARIAARAARAALRRAVNAVASLVTTTTTTEPRTMTTVPALLVTPRHVVTVKACEIACSTACNVLDTAVALVKQYPSYEATRVVGDAMKALQLADALHEGDSLAAWGLVDNAITTAAREVKELRDQRSWLNGTNS